MNFNANNFWEEERPKSLAQRPSIYIENQPLSIPGPKEVLDGNQRRKQPYKQVRPSFLVFPGMKKHVASLFRKYW